MTIVETGPATAQAYIYDLLAGASIEALPSQLLKKPEMIDPMTMARVFIPYLAGSDLGDTVQATRGLAGYGRLAVPHLPARAFTSREELSGWLSQIRDTGTDHLLLIAGDASDPRGPFQNTLDIIDSGLVEYYDYKTVFVAGHPEGHPMADEAVLIDALATKRAWADSSGIELRVVTQFTFDIERFVNWMREIDHVLAGTPVHLGITGPANPATLAKYALQCGVKLSGTMMLKNANARKLMTSWAPDDLIKDLAAFSDVALPSGIHIFPFGGIRKTADWIAKNSSYQWVNAEC